MPFRFFVPSKKARKVFAYLCAAILLLPGCGRQKVDYKNRLRISFHSEPSTLDPRRTGDVISATMAFLLFSGLTELQSDGTVQLALADSCELSPDGTAYTFHLKERYWSNKDPITAYDFENSWKKVVDPLFPSIWTSLFYPIKNAKAIASGHMAPAQLGITAKDSKTLRVELEKPFAKFLELISFCVFFPIHNKNDMAAAFWSRPAEGFICSGPFYLQKWRQRDEIVLTKNPHYQNSKNVLIESISISIIPDENTALEMFEKGKLDLLCGGLLSPLPQDSLSTLAKKKELIIRPVGSSVLCVFNTKKKPFCNKNIRKAFSLAINRTALTDNISQLNSSAAARALPPILMGDLQTNRQIEDHNIAKAKKCLQKGLRQLGLDQTELKVFLSFGSSLLHKKLAEVLSDQWQKGLGVFVALQQAEEKLTYVKIRKHQYQIALRNISALFFDPINILERFKYDSNSKNYPAWENMLYSKLLDEAEAALDPDQRSRLLLEAEAILAKELPFTPLYHCNYALLKRERVKNLTIGPIGNLHLEKIYLLNSGEKNDNF